MKRRKSNHASLSYGPKALMLKRDPAEQIAPPKRVAWLFRFAAASAITPVGRPQGRKAHTGCVD